jgi:hypothetical protein
VFKEPLMVARDLNPMPSKHFHVPGLKSQLELGGNVVMQQFASPGHYEGMLRVRLQLREELAPERIGPFQMVLRDNSLARNASAMKFPAFAAAR